MHLRFPSWTKPLAVCLALVAITWLVFGQTLRYDFVNYDDPGYVTQNRDVSAGLSKAGVIWAFTHVHGGNWHPLTSLSHMLDAQLFGMNPGGHHFTNVLLHSIAVVLLFLVLRMMTGAMWRSAFVAALFAIHPLRAESVAWIAERKDVLSAVFFMLTLGAYVYYVRKPTLVRYAIVLVLFALGLLAKPMLVTLPFLLLLIDYWPLQRILDWLTFRKFAIEKIPLLILSAASSVAAVLAQKQALALGTFESIPLSWRVTNAIVSCVVYIRQMFWPSGLGVFYPHPEDRLSLWVVVVCGVLLLAATIGAIAVRKRHPYVFTGWFWYLIMLVPVLGFVQIGLQGHADRYTYLPQIGLYLLVTWTVADLLATSRERRQLLSGVALIVIAVLAWCAWIQTSFWRDSERLWSRALAVTSDNDVAHTNLSELLLRRGRYSEAIPQAEAAIKIRPDNGQAYYNLGLAFLRTGYTPPAISYFKKSLEVRPEGVNAALTLAWVLATAPDPSLRDGEKAVQLAQYAIEIGGPSNPTLLHTLAAAYAEAGRYDDAIHTAEEAMRLAKIQKNALLTEELHLNLVNYQKNLPLRDQGLTNAPATE